MYTTLLTLTKLLSKCALFKIFFFFMFSYHPPSGVSWVSLSINGSTTCKHHVHKEVRPVNRANHKVLIFKSDDFPLALAVSFYWTSAEWKTMAHHNVIRRPFNTFKTKYAIVERNGFKFKSASNRGFRFILGFTTIKNRVSHRHPVIFPFLCLKRVFSFQQILMPLVRNFGAI